jgi:hypothetical protein
MSSSTCNFKKDNRNFVKKCRYGCDCKDFSKAHREKFYHTCFYDLKCINYTLEHRLNCPHIAFYKMNEDRLRFVINASKYSKSKKQKNKDFDPSYLWDHFSCDFLIDPNEELHRDFLITSYNYVESIKNKLDKLNISENLIEIKELEEELMIIYSTLFKLEQDAITGIYYLNQSFMMWLFNKHTIEDLNSFLIKNLHLDALYGLHFNKLFDIVSKFKIFLNTDIKKSDLLDIETFKTLYANYMLSKDVKFTKYKKRFRDDDEIEKVKEQENFIIHFQKQMRDSSLVTLNDVNYKKNNSSSSIQILNISNTGLNNIIEKILVSREIPKEQWEINYLY